MSLSIRCAPERRRSATAAPSRLEKVATVPTGVALTHTDRVAYRGNQDHLKAIAVLAYTHHWNDFIKWHLCGRTNYLKPFTINHPASLYVAVFAFFAPMNALDGLREADIAITLPDPNEIGNRRPACVPTLHIRGLHPDEVATIAEWIAANRIVPAGARRNPERAFWNATINTLVSYLHLATEKHVRGDDTLELYRGMKDMPTLQVNGEERLLRALRDVSSAFTSTSTSPAVAFSGDFTEKTSPEDTDESTSSSWVLVLQIEEGVRLLSVENTLPQDWICHADEREVLIAPGAHYTLDCFRRGNTDDQWIVHVRVSVTDLESLSETPEVQRGQCISAIQNNNLGLLLRLLTTGEGGLLGANFEDAWGATMLALAVDLNHFDIVLALLRKRVDVHIMTRRPDDYTPFPDLVTVLMMSKSYKMTSVLLEVGSNPLAKTSQTGKLAIMVAAKNAEVDVVHALLQHATAEQLVARDTLFGYTALVHATMSSKPSPSIQEMVRLLLDNRADVNSAGLSDGATALMHAAKKDIEVVIMLLAEGANVDAKDHARDGNTARDYALHSGMHDIVEYLDSQSEVPGTPEIEIYVTQTPPSSPMHDSVEDIDSQSERPGTPEIRVTQTSPSSPYMLLAL
jgi:ankyrin repeat protein